MQITLVIDELYRYQVTEPNPEFWPDYLKSCPIQGHGLYSFYQGLKLGLQLADACLDRQ